MPIHVPGKRNRRGRASSGKRSAVAVLQLTAMVDMFTVLVVFLLQNYATTGEILHIPKGVVLPKAGAVKELKPANVVVVSKDSIMLNNKVIVDYLSVKEQSDPIIKKLQITLMQHIENEALKANNVDKLKKAVARLKKQGIDAELGIPPYKRITIQADEDMEYETVKKVMYTVTEAGVEQINFAVMKTPKPAGN